MMIIAKKVTISINSLYVHCVDRDGNYLEKMNIFFKYSLKSKKN